MNYQGKQVLVLGLGESGLAMARWLARCGATLVVADTREAPARLSQLQESVPGARFVAGEFTPALLDACDFVAVSPGLGPNQELAAILPAALERGIAVQGEIEMFAQALASLKESRQYQPKVIAITGTNGKTTVTSMTGLLCQRAGLSTRVAGNISPAALDVLSEALDAEALPEVWVLELSSFQLHFTRSLNADVATVLNLTQDHLDWHGSMDAYAADKARIFGPTTLRVLNRDDELVMSLAAPTARAISFGREAPNAADCMGLVNENGMSWLVYASSEQDGEPRGRRRRQVQEVEIMVNRLMPVDALKIRGQHNAMNALAALMLCRGIGLPLAPLLHGLREYAGEPHRVELVATIGGVEYYDDSKGTNVGATVAAILGMGLVCNGRLLLIAGGDGKGQSFAPLAAPVARYVRDVILIGRDGPAIATALDGTSVPQHSCDSMQAAVMQAAALAQPGDAVLMSPACASYDMYRSYLHRAEVYVDAVRELGLSRGEVIA
jgi:UDP-N-acetylmuramoylalanine--D-glutamate ligase